MSVEQEISHSSRMHQYVDVDDDDDDTSEVDFEGYEDGDEDDDDNGKSGMSKLCMFTACGGDDVSSGRRGRSNSSWSLGQVLDPRAKWVQEWNRVFLLVCATGLVIDPLFFYAVSISGRCMCLFVDGWFAITVTALRCMTDVLHVWNMWLQLKMAKRYSFTAMVGGGGGGGEGGGNGVNGLRETSARSVAMRYLKGKKGFLFDLFVILPIPQGYG